MRNRVQVRVSAGEDPATGERIILVDSVPIELPGDARSERAAMKQALRRDEPRAGGQHRARHHRHRGR